MVAVLGTDGAHVTALDARSTTGAAEYVSEGKQGFPLALFHSLAAAWGILCCLLVVFATVNSCYTERQLYLCCEYSSLPTNPFFTLAGKMNLI